LPFEAEVVRLPRVRLTVRCLMASVSAFAIGLSIAPAWAPALSLLTPIAAAFAVLCPVALVVPAVLVLILAAPTEIILGFPVPLWIYVPVGSVMAGAIWPRRSPRLHPRRLAALGVVVALIAALYLVPWTTRKPFLRALDTVKPGMPLVEVRRAMAGYIEGTGWRDPDVAGEEITIGGAVVFRHSNEPQFNADFGIVYLTDGRVTHVEFSPD
jgi:hypothetical protein